MIDKELHRVVSTAIIYKNDKFLIIQRSLEKRAWPGKWTLPGGGLSTDDYVNMPKTIGNVWYNTVDSSLRREIKEEVDLEVGKLEYLCDISFIRPDGVPVVTLSFYCPYQSGEVKLDSESINFAWVAYEEAKNYDLIEGMIDEIKLVNDILNKEED